jgi:hypothetical protein
MKKSYILTDIFLVDQQLSSSYIREQKTKRNSTVEVRKSTIQGSRIIYPKSDFIAKKLKRIINSYLKTAFYAIKGNRKQLINLDLLNKLRERFLICGFFNIKTYAQSHKGSKL